jgi:predicted ester cyclase
MPFASDLAATKLVVQRFNYEVIAQGNRASFEQLMDPAFVNHSAPAGADAGPEGMWHTFTQVLRPALSDLAVLIEEQVAEGDLVTTRKRLTGTHTGTLVGIAPTGRPVSIAVIDMVRVRTGRYFEHWGLNTLTTVLQQLAQPA